MIPPPGQRQMAHHSVYPRLWDPAQFAHQPPRFNIQFRNCARHAEAFIPVASCFGAVPCSSVVIACFPEPAGVLPT